MTRSAKERWWVEPEVRSQLARVAPLDVAAWSTAAADATWLSSDRQSAVARVDGPVPLLVKWRRVRKGRRGKTFGRASRERREARAYLRLASRGLRAPTPWAVGERRRHGLLVGSVLVRPFHEDCLDGANVDSERRIGLAADLRAWHDAGFRHGDCYPKNVLVPDSGAPPFPVGCPAARFRAPGTKIDRRRARDLAQWVVGMQELEPDAPPYAFLETYCEKAGLPGPDALERTLQATVGHILAKKARRRATQPAREPDGPPKPTPLDTGVEVQARTAPLHTLTDPMP